MSEEGAAQCLRLDVESGGASTTVLVCFVREVCRARHARACDDGDKNENNVLYSMGRASMVVVLCIVLRRASSTWRWRRKCCRGGTSRIGLRRLPSPHQSTDSGE